MFGYGQTAWEAWKGSKFKSQPFSEVVAVMAIPRARRKKMTKARRRKMAVKAEPKKIVSIATASSKDGPVLYALTEEGEIYEYGVVQDEDLGAEVGMWEQLSTIEPRNIVDDAEVEDE